MTRLQQALTRLRLLERRAKGLEAGDDALSRLHLETFAAAPIRWLTTTLAKLAVVFAFAVICAGLFAAGNAVLRALGVQH